MQLRNFQLQNYSNMFHLLVILYMSIQVERGICNIGLHES